MLGAMSDADLELVRRAWRAFADGDVDAVVQAFDPDVRWHAAGEPDGDGACHSRADAEAFLRGLLDSGVTAELQGLRVAGGRLVASVRLHLPGGPADQPPPHGELITVRGGRVAEVLVFATAEDALAAARGGGGGPT